MAVRATFLIVRPGLHMHYSDKQSGFAKIPYRHKKTAGAEHPAVIQSAEIRKSYSFP
jgi:hypothetical protein